MFPLVFNMPSSIAGPRKAIYVIGGIPEVLDGANTVLEGKALMSVGKRLACLCARQSHKQIFHSPPFAQTGGGFMIGQERQQLGLKRPQR
jgi:hypothetical protein